MRTIEAAGHTFGVDASWGAKLDHKQQLAAFWQDLKDNDPPLQVAVAGMDKLRHDFACRVLVSVDGEQVADADASLRALDEDVVEELMIELGVSERISSAEGNAEPDSTPPLETGSPESQ